MASRGFTLIETVMVALIIGVVLAIAVPSFGRYRTNLVLRQARHQLQSDLRFARQLSVTRRSPVYVRFGDGVTTTNVSTYLIHVDANGNGLKEANEIRSVKRLPKGTRLSLVSLSPVDTLAFDISGILWPLGTSGGSLVMQNDRNKADTLLVSATGVVYRP